MKDRDNKSEELRKKAERMLKQKGVQDQALYHQDLESLVEELSIHQIELEQQNEELKRIQNELEISRNQYSELFNQAPIGYFIVRQDYRISKVNHTGAGMLSMSPTDLKDQKITTYIHPDYQDTFYFHLKSILRTGEPQSCELVLKDAEGNAFFVALESRPEGETEDPTGSVRCALMDISERKQKDQMIRESEEKYRAIFENSGDGFLVMGDKIEDCNKQAARMFGYSCEEMAGKDPVTDLSPEKQPGGENSRTAGKRHVRRALDGEVRQFYWKHIRSDGRTIDTEITLNSIDTRQGRRIVAIVHDLSEYIEQQRQLKEKNEEIQTQNEEYITLNDELHEANERLKNTLSRLRYSEELLNETGDMARVGGWEVDLQQQTVYWTRTTRDIHEIDRDDYTPTLEEAIGFFPGESRKILEDAIDRAIQKGEHYDLELELITAKGNHLYVRAIGRSTFQENRCTRLHGTFQDITERKQAEDELRKSEAKFRSLYNNATDAIFILDMDGHVLDANDIACNRLGYEREDLVQMNPRDFTTEYYAAKFEERLELIARDGSASFETEHTTRKGKIIPVEVNARVIEYARQKAILKISRDITERKKAEKEMVIKNRISNTFINRDHDNFYSDVLDIFREVFESRYGFFGYINDEGDLVSQSLTKDVWDECQVPGKTFIFPHSSWTGVWGKAMMEKKTLYRNENLQLPRGHVQLESALAAPVLFNDQLLGQVALANKPGGYDEEDREQIIHLCNYIAPLLYSKRQEEKYKKSLLEAKKKAEESDRLKSAFLANMSHEIRTPMNGILGFTQLLRERKVSDDKQQHFLQLIDDQSRHLLNIINDIIDISKIEANQLSIERHGFCLNDLMLELYNAYALQVENEGNSKIKLELSLAFSRDQSKIYSDKIRLKQILTNLLSNAFKFTTEGKVVFGYDYADGQNLRFFVLDTGMGIPRDKKADIFKRFRQADESPTSAQHEGTGLGLSISQNLVHLLGGEIWVESEENKGSVFYFTIPYQVPDDAESSADEGFGSEKVEYDWKGAKVLVVEDDPVSRKYLESVLKDTGSDIVLARNGQEAFRKFAEIPDLSLILMDIQLPDRSGRKVTEDIRATSSDIPIIAQTAYAMREDKVRCMESGCNDYITKPIDPQALLAVMNRHLNSNGG